MEPEASDARLTPVTAQDPRPRGAHETHDRLLVARFALDDELAPDETAAVHAQIAGCAECAALVDELRVVQHATATSTAPARSRDFFLTPEQAEWLRPNPWQRMLSRFSAPRAATLRPLAGATLAIGILLVGASAVLPRASNAPATDQVSTVTSTEAPAGSIAPQAMELAPDGSPGADLLDTRPVAEGSGSLDGSQARAVAPASPDGVGMVGARPKATADTADDGAGQAPVPTAAPELMTTTDVGQGSPTPAAMSGAGSPPPAAMSGPAGTPSPSQVAMMAVPAETPGTQEDVAGATAVAPADDPVGRALLIAGVLLALVSVAVLVLTWLARRAADPLLR